MRAFEFNNLQNRFNKNKLLENIDLFEINMSPSNLKNLVKDIDALAGIEFEMYVPNISEGEEGESEPDYGEDEQIFSIDNAVSFFDDGDYNSSRDLRNLREELNSEYYEWLEEQIEDKWQDEGRDYLRDYIHNNELYDGSEEDLEAQLENSWDARDDNYEQARDEFREEFESKFDESVWLDAAGYIFASDIENNFDITWPYMLTYDSDGEMDINSVAEDFEQMIGRPVDWSSSYHEAGRRSGAYAVEPDTSLDEPNDSSDGGLEFISPPLPIDELLSDMKKIREWAKKRGAYTNQSTGLHMNISIPNVDSAKLDYVKLAVLLGDNHVLEQFGRAANSFTSSALHKIRRIIQNDPDRATAVLEKMRGNMEDLATKAIHSGRTDKYTSINNKGNYIEFRGPGGDYLGDKQWENVIPTLLRSVVALDAAMDPNKYREEYQKKLYKLLTKDNKESDPVSDKTKELLSQYLALTDTYIQPGAVVGKEQERQEKIINQFASELLTQRQSEREAQTQVPAGQTQSGDWAVWSNARERFATIGNSGTRRFNSRADAEAWIRDYNIRFPEQDLGLVARKFTPSAAAPAQSATGNRGSFSGEWKIVDANGREIHRFGGVGNVQADANRVASAWLRQNPGNMRDGVEVVPVMDN